MKWWWLGILCSVATAIGSTNAVVLPFEVKRGHIIIPALLNITNKVSLMVDTGYEMTMIQSALAQKLGLKPLRQMTIVGIAGEEQADVFESVNFTFGAVTYSPRRVAALQAQRATRGWDGILGSGLFRRFVVEIHPSEKKLALIDPPSFVSDPEATALPIQIRRGTPSVDAEIIVAGEKAIPGRFEIDTGCDGDLCLGHDFVEANRIKESAGATKSSGRRGVGGGAGTVSATLAEFRLGSLHLAKPEAELFTIGSPAERGMAGHIGWGILSKCESIAFDYQRNQLLIKPPAMPSH
jgi:predicted aspartyl protease